MSIKKKDGVGNSLLLFQVSRRLETAAISGAEKRDVDLWTDIATFPKSSLVRSCDTCWVNSMYERLRNAE